ncbi:MAG: hypothetical protein NVS2B5_03100 [Beijerinckiaceae bacterium]
MRPASNASLNLVAAIALSSSVFISFGTPADAARRCPLGEILRVSKNTCEPKADNLDLLAHHRTKPKAVVEAKPEREQTTIVDKTAPVEGRATAAARESSSAPRSPPASASEQVAERDTPAEENLFVPKVQAKPVEQSPYGELFVGAFKGSLAGDAAAPH